MIVGSFLSNKQLRFRIRDLFTPFRDLVGEFLHTSIPVLLSDCLLGLGDNVLAIIMGRIGSGFVTANSITMVIQRVSTIVIMGLAFSGCFQTGQVLGKGEVQAARRQGNTYLLIGLVFGALASVINPVDFRHGDLPLQDHPGDPGDRHGADGCPCALWSYSAR